ncbi:MAG TPA: zinc-dependent peptidase [Steroidobacteraceae bacterium]|nr:zinc-dependent peptidase [Steroidobacteraceae bacterium]
MTPLAAVALAAAAVLAWLLAGPVIASRRRRAAMARPLDPQLVRLIERNVPLRGRLPADLAARHDALVSAFLAEKEFVGCGGLEITDEVRATIAALACVLVIGRRGHYDELHSVLVYPAAFWVEDEVEDEAGVVQKRRRDLSGEAWESSRIILSWEDVLESAHFPGEGYNVALHEFAHYLDAEGLGLAPPDQSGTSGAARHRTRSLDAWSADLVQEFEAFQSAVDREEQTFLDPYAAEDATEFFAVATEDFFERAAELRDAHPRLYELLQEFYALDPASWRASAAGLA